MKQYKFFCLCLVVIIITACGPSGVPSQSSNPGLTEPGLNTPLPPPTEQEQVTFPQMTQTAMAFPTVIYPTLTPMSPEALFDLSQSKTTSPDGKYVITCDYTFPTLFYAPTKTVIATVKGLSCDNAVFWAPDNSYAFIPDFGFTGTFLYRWRVDGSQPEKLPINLPDNPAYLGCRVKMSWSPDGRFFAIDACGIFVIRPSDESSFQNPLLIEKYYYEDFRWATHNMLMIDYHRAYGFFFASTGKALSSWARSGGVGCLGQPPFISPDENWVVFDQCRAGGDVRFYDQYALTNLENGSTEIFSKLSGDRIEFIGWKPDGTEFYLVSRPTTMNAQADPRTPFGLLALNPQTRQARNLFEQAQYISFNKDFSWAYVVFPVKNQNDDLRLDGGLWQVGSSQLLGQQVMASAVDERFLNPYGSPDTGSMYSADGKELGFSSQTVNRPLPGIWSHDNTLVATINFAHQLTIIDLRGEVKFVGQLEDNQEWLYPQITWSADDKTLDVAGVAWTVQ